MRLILAILITLAFPLLTAVASPYPPTQEVVARIVDGDTLVTESGKTVRLLNMNTPETAKRGKPAQPFADAAKSLLYDLVMGQKIKLVYQDRLKDRYNRYLAEVYRTSDGLWVNKALVAAGMAHVYTFPDNAHNAQPLLEAENMARANKQGIWQHPRWKLLTPDTVADEHVRLFNVVEGEVRAVAKVKGTYFLNFGDDWRRDFSVEIRSSVRKKFKKAGINVAEDFLGKSVRVRGFVKPVNGSLITITHPEQLSVIDASK